MGPTGSSVGPTQVSIQQRPSVCQISCCQLLHGSATRGETSGPASHGKRLLARLQRCPPSRRLEVAGNRRRWYQGPYSEDVGCMDFAWNRMGDGVRSLKESSTSQPTLVCLRDYLATVPPWLKHDTLRKIRGEERATWGSVCRRPGESRVAQPGAPHCHLILSPAPRTRNSPTNRLFYGRIGTSRKMSAPAAGIIPHSVLTLRLGPPGSCHTKSAVRVAPIGAPAYLGYTKSSLVLRTVPQHVEMIGAGRNEM